MYLKDLDKVVKLRDRHREIGRLREAVLTGSIEGLMAWNNGASQKVFDIIEKTSVRQAVIATCDQILKELESELGALNVNTACKLE